MNVINLTSISAYNLLKENLKSFLIDVRTKEEQIQNGVPKISNDLFQIAWRSADMRLNELFKSEFDLYLNNINLASPIFFICRTGGRSFEAASLISKTGFTNCYNIVDGFDGGTWGAGWKQNNLPWQRIA